MAIIVVQNERFCDWLKGPVYACIDVLFLIHLFCRHMTSRSKKLPVVFYASSGGREPVREWLKSLDQDDRRAIGADIFAVQMGWPLGLPLCRSLGEGLWEVRSSLPSRRIARVIFAFDAGEIVLLNGFIKKTQKTPTDEIELAMKRLREMTA